VGRDGRGLPPGLKGWVSLKIGAGIFNQVEILELVQFMDELMRAFAVQHGGQAF
jgi:hypothetical protein